MCISARNWDLSTSIMSQGLLLNGCPGVRVIDEDGIVLCERERQGSLARLLLSPSIRHPGAESASIKWDVTQELQIWKKSDASMLFPKFRSIEREMYPTSPPKYHQTLLLLHITGLFFETVIFIQKQTVSLSAIFPNP